MSRLPEALSRVPPPGRAAPITVAHETVAGPAGECHDSWEFTHRAWRIRSGQLKRGSTLQNHGRKIVFDVLGVKGPAFRARLNLAAISCGRWSKIVPDQSHRPLLKCLGLAAALSAGLAAGVAAAQNPPPLNQEPHINGSLLAAAVGEIIVKKCDSISPRYLVVFSKAKALERYARNLGFGEAEIEAFLDDKAEERRIRKAAHAYLAAQGVVKDDNESYCAAGRAEIEKGTLTGSLMRSRRQAETGSQAPAFVTNR